MAKFSKKIPAKYQQLDYSGVLDNYNWIKESIEPSFEEQLEFAVEISFNIGDIACTCNTIDEFKEYAYGQAIDTYSFNIRVTRLLTDASERIAYIIINPYSKIELVINCDKKDSLINVSTALENNAKQTIPLHPVVQQVNIHDESITITGDGNKFENSAIGKQNKIETKPAKDSFWKPIFQALISNWIWFLIGAMLLIYLGTNVIDWTSIF
ncbi:hypothetical protein [Anaerotignum sp.]|uniref:hypothetical protein n=1 Tax=Anaerotignum sp. TaxID=2039241 RepID=UPI0028AA80AE|nr:hypothetical protein [Anaerotignum sp.]